MHRTWIRIVATVPLAAAIAACGDSPTATSPTPVTPTPVTLSAELRTTLERSIQDEYRSESIYQGVVADLGPARPFVNVLTAEQRHSAAIAGLFVARGVPAPLSEWTLERVPHFTSLTAACAAAVVAERENIALYDALMRADLPSDVRQVFTNNRNASLVNQLPAFERCA